MAQEPLKKEEKPAAKSNKKSNLCVSSHFIITSLINGRLTVNQTLVGSFFYC